MAGTFARFVWVASQPCPRCMCSYGALTLKTANIRFMSNGNRLMNVQERHLPKKKWKLRTLALAFGSSTVAYVVYRQDAKVKNLEHDHGLAKTALPSKRCLGYKNSLRPQDTSSVRNPVRFLSSTDPNIGIALSKQLA